nr:isochorismatase family protein [Lachnospiraceae bacterium]
MRKVLIVVDMQNDFVTGALRNEEAIAIVPNVVKKVKEERAKDTDIIFTRDTHKGDYMNTEEGRNLPVPHCIYKTEGWEIIDELKELADDSIV